MGREELCVVRFASTGKTGKTGHTRRHKPLALSVRLCFARQHAEGQKLRDIWKVDPSCQKCPCQREAAHSGRELGSLPGHVHHIINLYVYLHLYLISALRSLCPLLLMALFCGHRDTACRIPCPSCQLRRSPVRPVCDFFRCKCAVL